jgi:hypothetical protein
LASSSYCARWVISFFLVWFFFLLSFKIDSL